MSTVEVNQPQEPQKSDGFADFDDHLEKLLLANHPRIMNLEMLVPRTYPWEELLQKHFANPPFRLVADDYEIQVMGNRKILRIKETRKPATFYALLRFLEFFRSQLVVLSKNLAEIESKYDLIRRTNEETTGVRGLLRNMRWNYDMIDQKHEIIGKALNQKSGLDDILKKLETILTKHLPVTSKWQYLIEPLYKATIEHINRNFRENSFNLRMFFPVRAMEEKLAPHYSDAMHLVVELADAVQQTTVFLSKKT